MDGMPVTCICDSHRDISYFFCYYFLVDKEISGDLSNKNIPFTSGKGLYLG